MQNFLSCLEFIFDFFFCSFSVFVTKVISNVSIFQHTEILQVYQWQLLEKNLSDRLNSGLLIDLTRGIGPILGRLFTIIFGILQLFPLVAPECQVSLFLGILISPILPSWLQYLLFFSEDVSVSFPLPADLFPQVSGISWLSAHIEE